MVTPAFSIALSAPGSRLSQVAYPAFSLPPPASLSVWPAPRMFKVPTVIGLTVSPWQLATFVVEPSSGRSGRSPPSRSVMSPATPSHWA